MTELALLSRIAGGQQSFTRAAHPDLDEIDRRRLLTSFESSCYILKAIRETAYGLAGPTVKRVDVIGGLTVAGEAHSARLAGYAE